MNQPIRTLTDPALLENTRRLVTEERKITLEVLEHLREVERRKLFAFAGYGSLFDYCVKDLGYSESSAYRRIASMRLLKELPELQDPVKEGKLSLSVLSTAQSFFQQEQKNRNGFRKDQKLNLLQSLEGLSRRETERRLATDAR